jgi:hypothetical protein
MLTAIAVQHRLHISLLDKPEQHDLTVTSSRNSSVPPAATWMRSLRRKLPRKLSLSLRNTPIVLDQGEDVHCAQLSIRSFMPYTRTPRELHPLKATPISGSSPMTPARQPRRHTSATPSHQQRRRRTAASPPCTCTPCQDHRAHKQRTHAV